jgi:hypothetical protein
MNKTEHIPADTKPSAAAEARVSELVGDRLCIRCGFNLVGQPIVREPVYGLLMVRCPECSTPVALQEYPVLGRWASRWATLLAALWVLVLVLMLVATTAIIGGLSGGAAEAGGQGFATYIAERHNEWLAAQDDKTKQAMAPWVVSGTNVRPGPYTWIDTAWWQTQDPIALLRAAGGLRKAVRPEIFEVHAFLLIVGAIAGVFWSVALLSVRRPRVMLLMLMPVALAAGVGWLILRDSPATMFGGVMLASQAATAALGVPLFFLSLLVALPALWVGVLVGRPLTRGLVRALLPPRMQGSLAFLWTVEGLPPPRPARR